MGKNSFQTTRLERMSYGGFFLGQNIIYVIQFQFLMYFYTEYVGLSLGHTTTMLLIAKLWDAFNDPIMGAIVDKVNFKKEKYLPWLRFVTYILPLSMFFVFINIDAAYNVKLIYAYITYIIFGMVYTVSDSPLFSLATVMSRHAYERDTLISHGRLAAALAAILSAAFMSIKVKAGWTLTAGVYCVVAFLVMFPMQFHAKERVKYHRSSDITFQKIFRFLFKNKYLLLYYIGYLAISATNTLQTMAVYFANSNLGDETLVTVIMAVVIIPVIIVAPFLPTMIKAFGKKKLTIYSSAAMIILSVIQYFAGYENLAVFLGIAAVRVTFMQIPLLIYGMFTADCIEYGAYINGERTEGIAFSIQTFITKLGGAISATLSLSLLGLFGYVKQAPIQSADTLEGIWIIMSLVPIIGYAIMILIMYVYKLNEKDVALMMEHNQAKLGLKETSE
ncbi:MFS transporter [Mobilitalea sibirica]|uniref:MFS transporter n=1 Tax=Mobilitalea sibirica TaxID=1462919 RepID=A0A8J7HBR1_9FIRM|nr:glycoside-pentoside-hexuronide (GPH):cation symporter [Mobilitalea sibirica]MBH1939514.1 MFS transporter [Mobilitalea sibirica]